MILEYGWDGHSGELTVQGEMILGRSEDCDVVLPLERASRRHARIFRRAGEWYVQDLGSLNGTTVNGAEVQGDRLLSEGDVIELAGARLTVRESAAAAPEPTPAPAAEEPTERTDQTIFVTARSVRDLLGGAGSAPDSEAPTGTEQAPEAKDDRWAVELASSAAEALLASTDLDVVLEALLGVAFDYLPAQRGLIGLRDEETGEVRSRAVVSEDGEEFRVATAVAREVLDEHKAVVIQEVGTDGRFSATDTLVRTSVRSAISAPMIHRDTVQGLIYLDTRDHLQKFGERDLEVLSAIGLFSAIAIERTLAREEIEEQERIRQRLERYTSKAVVERVTKASTLTGMLAEERDVTVLFADICGFTALSEGLEPAKVSTLLNALFDQLTNTVEYHGGTVDKFLGDGLMAFFGAPEPDPDHALKAVRAAWEMCEVVKRIDADLDLLDGLRMRFGLNSGLAIAGDIGSEARRDYTVVGDTVNVASRLEGLAVPGTVVVGRTTAEAVKDRFELESLAPVQVKNRSEPVEPSRVVGPR